MATAKKTSFADYDGTLNSVEAAVVRLRQDGATNDAAIHFFTNGDGGTMKAEWHEEVPDPAAPAADTREQPTTVEPSAQ